MFISLIFQGRPKGVTPKFSLAPLVPRLSELLGIQVDPCLQECRKKRNKYKKGCHYLVACDQYLGIHLLFVCDN